MQIVVRCSLIHDVKDLETTKFFILIGSDNPGVMGSVLLATTFETQKKSKLGELSSVPHFEYNLVLHFVVGLPSRHTMSAVTRNNSFALDFKKNHTFQATNGSFCFSL